jgi:hypothetical protein
MSRKITEPVGIIGIFVFGIGLLVAMFGAGWWVAGVGALLLSFNAGGDMAWDTSGIMLIILIAIFACWVVTQVAP